jgi:DNA helicase-2/ATP-dependent DNA helicase PcrA
VQALPAADGPRASGTEELLVDLTPAQLEAVTTDAAPVIVVASAGAGKTRVLTRRIAYRVTTGSAEAGHVLALTFTRKAAGEMQERLRALGMNGQITAGTFHSVASAQLRRWWADLRRTPPTLLERKSRLLAPLVEARPALASTPLADLASLIEWAKARMITPEELATSVKVMGRQLPGGVAASEVADLYARYEHEKTRRGLIDFDDLLAGCAEAMERDPSFAAAQRWRWRHVFVDEFQDLNPLQFRLLLSWMGPNADLCAVGDPNQAIYGWNGADAGLLSAVAERWSSTEVVSLDDNHRCSPQIVKAAAAVLGSVGSRLSSSTAGGAEPTVRSFPSEKAEAQGTALAIRRAHLEGRPWSEMAVLARTNAQLAALQDALAAAGVPFWAPSAEPDSADDETAPRIKDDPDRGDDSVTLCSFHRAKGLEWDAVWVVGLETGFVPIARAGRGKAIEEERRLLYVALTRASRELHCSWARQRSFGGRPVPREPSPWLELIAPHDPHACATEPRDHEESIDFWRDRLRAQRDELAGRRQESHEQPQARRRGTGRRNAPRWPEPDPEIVADLRSWRSQAARASGVPPYVILHDVTLSAVASLRPRNEDELVSVPGLGPVKASRYGPTLLAIVAKRPVPA